MSGTFQFELVSPERLLMSEPAASVVVPGSEGDFAVLAGHAPVLSTLRPGIMNVTLGDGQARRIYVSGGFAEVSPESLTVLAQQAVDLAEADKDWAANAIEEAEASLAAAHTDEARYMAEAALAALRAI